MGGGGGAGGWWFKLIPNLVLLENFKKVSVGFYPVIKKLIVLVDGYRSRFFLVMGKSRSK